MSAETKTREWSGAWNNWVAPFHACPRCASSLNWTQRTDVFDEPIVSASCCGVNFGAKMQWRDDESDAYASYDASRVSVSGSPTSEEPLVRALRAIAINGARILNEEPRNEGVTMLHDIAALALHEAFNAPPLHQGGERFGEDETLPRGMWAVIAPHGGVLVSVGRNGELMVYGNRVEAEARLPKGCTLRRVDLVASRLVEPSTKEPAKHD